MMIGVKDLKTSSSTKMYITNATTIFSCHSSCTVCIFLAVMLCRLMLATLMSATPCPHEGARFLLEKSSIGFFAINKLQSTIGKCFVGYLVPGVSNHSRNVFKEKFQTVVDQILLKPFGWTANWTWTLGSVLLCSVYAIVALLIVLNCRWVLNDYNSSISNPSLSWAIYERVRCCRCNMNLRLNSYEK